MNSANEKQGEPFTDKGIESEEGSLVENFVTGETQEERLSRSTSPSSEPLVEGAEETYESRDAPPTDDRLDMAVRPLMASGVALAAMILFGILALSMWFQIGLLFSPRGCEPIGYISRDGGPRQDSCALAEENRQVQVRASRDRLLPIAVGLSMGFIVALVAFTKLRQGKEHQ